jgi:cell division protein FtsB
MMTELTHDERFQLLEANESLRLDVQAALDEIATLRAQKDRLAARTKRLTDALEELYALVKDHARYVHGTSPAENTRAARAMTRAAEALR